MSVIAIRWAYSRPIKNPVAKNVLVFLCTHDFSSNQMFFKIKTICAATSYGRTAVIEAIAELVEQGFLRKSHRFGDKGQQLSNVYDAVIDDEYIQEFYKAYELSTSPVHGADAPPSSGGPPPSATRPPISTTIKLNNKKSFCDQKQNSERHSFADSMDRKCETRQTAKFYESGNPDFDRVWG